MKAVILAVITSGLLSTSAAAKTPEAKLGMPVLREIKTITLSPSYSCRDVEAFARGYASTALYLMNASRDRTSPELLFNGACGSEDSFDVSLAGDDMSLIADLGPDVPLESLSASRTFNLRRVHSYELYSKFVRVAKVRANHTYAVLLNTNDRRGLFVFTVTEHVTNKSVALRYAVLSYQIVESRPSAASPGFSWELPPR